MVAKTEAFKEGKPHEMIRIDTPIDKSSKELTEREKHILAKTRADYALKKEAYEKENGEWQR